ncbi:hypothetical protein DVK00_14785 [Haloarcula sp. Atlit-47R]|nr:hypothetical protein DVK00_14785 [Haloarcula sp. Atlit-47R]
MGELLYFLYNEGIEIELVEFGMGVGDDLLLPTLGDLFSALERVVEGVNVPEAVATQRDEPAGFRPAEVSFFPEIVRPLTAGSEVPLGIRLPAQRAVFGHLMVDSPSPLLVNLGIKQPNETFWSKHE